MYMYKEGGFRVADCLPSRVCNRLSGYSGYSDIRKNLSVRMAT